MRLRCVPVLLVSLVCARLFAAVQLSATPPMVNSGNHFAGLPQTVKARDLWIHTDLPAVHETWHASVSPHDVVLLRVHP